MVQLEIEQGYGHESECPSEQRIVISGHGWRTQCCERDETPEKETEDMAAPECEREARKRRERRDSGGVHERKERRSRSEERLPPPPPPPPLQDYNRLESERRAERLSRARHPQFGMKRRRATKPHKNPKENDGFTIVDDTNNIQIEFACSDLRSRQISDEPETLDAAALQRQVGRVVSVDSADGDVVLAVVERVRRDERSAAARPKPRRDQICPETRLTKIHRKMNALKKTIAKYESDYEANNGHALTPGDRITDVQLTRMYEKIKKLQTEKRLIRADPVEYTIKLHAAKQQKERDLKLNIALKSDKPMTELVLDIEEWLEGSRQASGRSGLPESSWSPEEWAAEKHCIQRALCRLETARGRPAANTPDRDAARPLYDRYRDVKKCVSNFRPDSTKGANGELATIHEHEAMLFSVDSSSDSQEKPSDSSQETVETPLQSPPNPEVAGIISGEERPSSTSSAQSGDEPGPSNEGLHCLGLDDLTKALTDAKMQKCVLRRSIKEYEVSFEVQNCRKVQRDDKKGHEDEYLRYKAVKARIKLLNALIDKQKRLT
ncbi:protein FAM13A isoform X1 [Achroia grisella]|uniref:protein FAM13A isoform X1 n=2 Tax=Achroia grisella TaxID=688607 RepID=UPI0027D2FC37|nr:protein FAM13A isoform X1 [Achroia grisella]